MDVGNEGRKSSDDPNYRHLQHKKLSSDHTLLNNLESKGIAMQIDTNKFWVMSTYYN